MTTLLAQLTDLHIREPGRLAYGRLDTAPYLRAAVQAVAQLPQAPQALVLTGDLTDFGRAAEYAHLASLLSPLNMPLYLLPGNHDDRDQLRRSFAGHGYLGQDDFVQYTVALGGGLRLVALDTVETGQSAGRLCPRRLQWLDRTLQQHAGEPIVIAMHHPPFETLIGHMDRIGLLQGADELARILGQHPNVERVICGHLHRSIVTRFGGTIASTAPSPAHQVSLDLAPDAASTWTLEPPGFHLHAWTGPGRLLTHVAAIGSFDGPHPFHDGGKLID
ncbi:MAG TPA: phosphodiesterase [Rubrivivax sp.]|nr:phosphodiesterase [Rubrivivax sp.]